MGSGCLIRREFGAGLEIVPGLEPLWSSCPREAAVSHPPKGAGPGWAPSLTRCPGAGVVFALPAAFDSP